MTISQQIAAELKVNPRQIDAAVGLLDEGATVPFIARYRKEVTQGLDDTQLRFLEQRLVYLRELEDRRIAVIRSVEEQGKLTDELRAAFAGATTKTDLEDLYLPYKPKRRTKAQIAREAGIAPLAEALLSDPTLDPQVEAEGYLNADAGFADAQAVLDGAKQILMEQFSEEAALVSELREYFWDNAVLTSAVIEGQENNGSKFADYFEYSEQIAKIPSHRSLALFRGRNEGVLQLTLDLPEVDATAMHPCEQRIARFVGVSNQERAADVFLAQAVRWTWRVKLHTRLDVDLLGRLREEAEDTAITVFAQNLKDLLLAAPAGRRAVLGLDPGLRTGVKVAVVDQTGKLLATDTIYPHAPRNDWDGSLHKLGLLVKQHDVSLIAIGNGTASRETDRLAADLLKLVTDAGLAKIVVSEAGASVYSASELAAREFPNLDVSLRGAVSIARRLQDPLAELVKIDPKSIGVGQYQHDVSQVQLSRMLDAVVEDCVNGVGVDLNTASVPLLTRVSGLNATIASNIVTYRDEKGRFSSRKDLMNVPRLGAKTFEQAAGFLRIADGDDALDASSVHPEAYPVVHRILSDTGRDVRALIGDTPTLRKLDPAKFTDERFGLPTVQDILRELEKPGRDPRPEFKTATFKEGVEKIADLKPGMRLEGVVTNVTGFGAFVDVGVHQDGLVHISELSDTFVKDPHDVVSAGDVVTVRVMEVDVKRKRIGLSMKSPSAESSRGARAPQQERGGRGQESRGRGRQQTSSKQSVAPAAPGNTAMADALSALLKN